jgi:hypothetical protein
MNGNRPFQAKQDALESGKGTSLPWYFNLYRKRSGTEDVETTATDWDVIHFNWGLWDICRPLWQSISGIAGSPGSPLTPTFGFAQGDPRGHCLRGSKRGCSLAVGREK